MMFNEIGQYDGGCLYLCRKPQAQWKLPEYKSNFIYMYLSILYLVNVSSGHFYSEILTPVYICVSNLFVFDSAW